MGLYSRAGSIRSGRPSPSSPTPGSAGGDHRESARLRRVRRDPDPWQARFQPMAEQGPVVESGSAAALPVAVRVASTGPAVRSDGPE